MKSKMEEEFARITRITQELQRMFETELETHDLRIFRSATDLQELKNKVGELPEGARDITELISDRTSDLSSATAAAHAHIRDIRTNLEVVKHIVQRPQLWPAASVRKSIHETFGRHLSDKDEEALGEDMDRWFEAFKVRSKWRGDDPAIGEGHFSKVFKVTMQNGVDIAAKIGMSFSDEEMSRVRQEVEALQDMTRDGATFVPRFYAFHAEQRVLRDGSIATFDVIGMELLSSDDGWMTAESYRDNVLVGDFMTDFRRGARRVAGWMNVVGPSTRRLHDVYGINHNDFHKGNLMFKDASDGAEEGKLLDLGLSWPHHQRPLAHISYTNTTAPEVLVGTDSGLHHPVRGGP